MTHERDFSAIYRRYHQSLYRFCFSIVGNSEDAQDALQNTMLKTMRALPGEKREIQLRPWLYRIAHNESIELLRKRRDQVQIDPELASTAAEPAEIAALEERLQRLLGDLAALPERQRAALVMRELGGLEFTQIGEAFDTSAAVARQTVYEARLSLRQLEAGREMSCEKVMRKLSDADGRVTRRRDIQAHFEACPECREFGAAIDERRHDLAALAPLPAVASTSILHALLGGSHGGAGGGLAGTVGAGAGKAAATSTVVKSVAAVAVAATIGVSAANRSGLIDVGLPGGSGKSATTREATSEATVPSATNGSPADRDSTRDDSRSVGRHSVAGPKVAGANTAADRPANSPASVTSDPQASGGNPNRTSTSLPQASRHGQQTAASHKHQRGSHTSKAHSPSAAPHPAHGSAHSHNGSAKFQGGSTRASKGGSGARATHPHGQAQKSPQSPPPDESTGQAPEATAPGPNAGNGKAKSSS